jgi:protein-disulfide isomerase
VAVTSRRERKTELRREREQREREAQAAAARKQRLGLFAGLALLAAVVVVVAILISQSGTGGEPGGGGAKASQGGALFAGIPQSGSSLGDRKAPATLIEFADLQCPFCAEYTRQALPAVVRRYVRPGRMRLELRLLTFIGPDSETAARVAGAAALQNHMWDFTELFYRNQRQENSGYVTDDFLRQIARGTPGLDVQKAFAQRDGAAASRVVRQGAEDVNRLGVDSTPTFFVVRGGGKPQPLQLSALDAASFTAALDDALGR